MNDVEGCCRALLNYMLPSIDATRSGVAIDAGVGTFAFYCELFARLKFRAIAVEPLPLDSLRQVCSNYDIALVEACLSDVDGVKTLYSGSYSSGTDSINYSSIFPDWWGVSKEGLRVRSTTLYKLLSSIDALSVTCLKLDIEGAEGLVIGQFPSLPKALLPKIVMFEYGGGNCKKDNKGGWSPKFFSGTTNSLEILKKYGYGLTICIDAAPTEIEKIFSLQSLSLNPDRIFSPNSIYGNIISLQGNFSISERKIKRICAGYRTPPPTNMYDKLRKMIAINFLKKEK